MIATPIYITAGGQISMQAPLCDDWLTQPVRPEGPYVRSTDPDFKAYMSPGESRRLGKLLKRALAVALHTLREAGMERPEAIVTGTGLGSVESTETFLSDLVHQGEELLKPTPFMQSTHNTIGSLIAIHTATHGYNNTYAHREISFESALMDARLQLLSGAVENVLVGAHDGITPSYFTMLQRTGYVGQPGMVPCGETAVELLLRTAPPSDATPWCRLAGLRLLHRPTRAEVDAAATALLAEAELQGPAEVDAVLLGLNGDEQHDAAYAELLPAWCTSETSLCLHYKHLFGESYTAAALGTYVAAVLLREQCVPEPLILSGAAPKGALENLLVAHVYEGGRNVSLLLLQTSCGRRSSL